ncbi:MAG: NADH-quinone oxidoreductase subunit I [Candidatus Hatepunaea meridiana]|nr:NADH-quinone oxidoreductase subunit I [Candidatus Hatepunaea meridiana]
MQKKVTNITITPGFKEDIYWVEVFRGLWITNRHFFVNMWRLTLNLFGIKTKTRAVATYQYPEEHRPIHHRLRGRHRLTVRQNGSMRCTACMLCETICPCDCIHIIPGESPDPNVEKFPEQFTIDVLRCCFCGYCAEACPMDAIRMDVIEPEFASYTRDILFTKEFLMGQTKERPWEKWLEADMKSKGA